MENSQDNQAALKIDRNFLLGSSMSSWQFEGNVDGKYQKRNFMEQMYESDKANWHDQYGPNYGIDFLNNWEEDAQLMIDMGLQSLRLTMDWTRFYKDISTRQLNTEYIDTYIRFTGKLRHSGIKLILILEHWEMPYELHEKYQGYTSEVVQQMFVDFAEDVFRIFRGIFSHYMVFNEPIVIPQLCFIDRTWFPKESNLKYAIELMHAKNVISARVIDLFRKNRIPGEIGIGGINIEPVRVRDENNPEDLRAGEIASFFSGEMFIDPFIKHSYNPKLIDFLESENLMFDFKESEKELFKAVEIDFLGVNYYHPARICQPDGSSAEGFGKYFASYTDETKRINKDRGWEVKPDGLYEIGMKLKNEYGNIKWFVNENGFGTEEGATKVARHNGRIVDDYRSAFINEHLYQLMLLNQEGGRCFGYHTWAFMDNCSPYNAMKNRYGFIEIDIKNNYRRIPKKSYSYYANLIASREIKNNLRFEDYMN